MVVRFKTVGQERGRLVRVFGSCTIRADEASALRLQPLPSRRLAGAARLRGQRRCGLQTRVPGMFAMIHFCQSFLRFVENGFR